MSFGLQNFSTSVVFLCLRHARLENQTCSRCQFLRKRFPFVFRARPARDVCVTGEHVISDDAKARRTDVVGIEVSTS